MQIYTCFIQPVLYWRSMATFGIASDCNALEKLRLLCNSKNARCEWTDHYMVQATGGTAQSRFFLLYPIRPVGRIFCSREQSKLCFEALGTHSVPQNHLPLQGTGKHPPKSGFYWILSKDELAEARLKWICDEWTREKET
ncbi:hypothetical protein [Sphingobacterium humi]|uniref:Uncharacterized protein n=1 Tax=Sphingobacterium humi TaxID=1796905 RepID=A0A6N8L1Z3_9SPHI|nr:hypothetical protein [Sphingobacterium humi]MVZ63743.1 hypothetical protein [Sphingobacterium humi]